MRVLAIIPARYASTRFPAKPLAVLGRRCIIEWVYRAVSAAIDDVVVATDDRRIADAVEAFGGRVVMTSSEHRCGTERCAEALLRVGQDYDVVINVQGDEPFVSAEQLRGLVAMFEDESVDIATLATPITEHEGVATLEDPNVVKVVMSQTGRALYFSRSPIPFVRGCSVESAVAKGIYYRHVGIYGFRASTLSEVVALEASSLEQLESLEQLRWLDAGYNMKVGITHHRSIGIDTPEDLCRAEAMLADGYGEN